MHTVKEATLHFCEGSSDKIYKLAINETVDGFTVDFQYGRRGNSLVAGTKTSSPVNINKAESVFNKLLKEKTSKGYTEDPSRSVSQGFKWHQGLKLV